MYMHTYDANLANDTVWEDLCRLLPFVTGIDGMLCIVLPRADLFHQVEKSLLRHTPALQQIKHTLTVLDLMRQKKEFIRERQAQDDSEEETSSDPRQIKFTCTRYYNKCSYCTEKHKEKDQVCMCGNKY